MDGSQACLWEEAEMKLSLHHILCKRLWSIIQVTGKNELSIFKTSLRLEVRQEPQAHTESQAPWAVFLSSQQLHGMCHSS